MTTRRRRSRRWLDVLACTAALGLMAACTTPTGGTAQPPNEPSWDPRPTSGTAFDALLVGQLQHVWSESTSVNANAVPNYVDKHPPQLLLADQAAYDQWLIDLPIAFLDAASDVDLTDRVAVVGYYAKCMEQSAVFHLGAGQLVYDVWIPEEDEGTACAWSPVRVELWLIDLAHLDVDSAADVTLGY